MNLCAIQRLMPLIFMWTVGIMCLYISELQLADYSKNNVNLYSAYTILAEELTWWVLHQWFSENRQKENTCTRDDNWICQHYLQQISEYKNKLKDENSLKFQNKDRSEIPIPHYCLCAWCRWSWFIRWFQRECSRGPRWSWLIRWFQRECSRGHRHEILYFLLLLNQLAASLPNIRLLLKTEQGRIQPVECLPFEIVTYM